MCHRTCSPRDQTLCFFRDAEACRDANITLLAMYFTCDISLMYYSDSSSDFAQRDRTLHPRDPRTLTPQHENDAGTQGGEECDSADSFQLQLTRQFFHAVGWASFGGEKGERKGGGKFVFGQLASILYHKDAKYLHHSSNRLLFNLIKHNQPSTRLSFETRVEKNAVAVRF